MNFENPLDGSSTPEEEVKKERVPQDVLRELDQNERAELRDIIQKKRKEFLDSRE